MSILLIGEQDTSLTITDADRAVGDVRDRVVHNETVVLAHVVRVSTVTSCHSGVRLVENWLYAG